MKKNSRAIIFLFVFLIGLVMSSGQIFALESNEELEQVILIKNEKDELMEGVSFALKEVVDGEELKNKDDIEKILEEREEITTLISNAKGEIDLVDISEGKYWIIQTKALDGYETIKVNLIELPILTETIFSIREAVSYEEESKIKNKESVEEKTEELHKRVQEKAVESPLKNLQVKAEADPKDSTKYQIRTEGLAEQVGIGEVIFPTWSERKDQDDLKWYEGSKSSSGEYQVNIDLKDHGFETGKYITHTYVYGIRGELLGMFPIEYNQKPSSVEITTEEIENSSYKVRVKGVSNAEGVAGVLFPTWSNKNGQDDMRWESGTYIGNDTWEVTIDLRNYKEIYDTFYTHIYATSKTGKQVMVGATEKAVKSPLKNLQVKAETDPKDSTKYQIRTEGLAGQAGIGEIIFPTWSERKDQDDLKWYEGSKSSSGEYQVSIDLKDHGFETGKYITHTYVYGIRGELLGMFPIEYNQKPSSVEITTEEIENSSYKVRVKGVSNAEGVAGVLFPTWSNKNGQDDMRWESGTYIGNDTWEVTIDLKNYKESYDTFHTHIYATSKTGKQVMAGATEKVVESPLKNLQVKAEKDPKDSSKYLIRTEGLAGKGSVGKVLFPTWTDRNGQDDIRWHEGSKTSSGEYQVTIDIKDHGFETGNYITHTYIYGNNGEVLGTFALGYNQKPSTLEVSIGEASNNNYKVKIKGASNPEGVKNILFPTWTESDGQDDMRWESGNYVGNDTWEATIAFKNYSSKRKDNFITHAYVTLLNDTMVLKGTTNYEVTDNNLSEFNGIDVSEWQGKIRWAEASKDIDFVILRTGWGWSGDGRVDARFYEYYDGAKNAGIPVGVYHYSYAQTPAEAKKEAEYCLSILKGRSLDFPIAFDVEDEKWMGHLSKKEITDITIAFCETIKAAGYKPMVYANLSWYRNKLDYERIKEYPLWLAQYNNVATYEKPIDMWQYSSTGNVKGIDGNVDMNISYRWF